MLRYYAALPRPITLASGRPVQPGEEIAGTLLTRTPAPGSDPEDEHPELVLAAHDQRLLDDGRLLPVETAEVVVIDAPDLPADNAPDARSRRGRRPTETPED